jgi:eukaryotic-like serine/threonine-protein kinase
MTSERWVRIKSMFSAAAELPAGDRAGYLAREAQGDASLINDVQSLLESHEAAGEFLEPVSSDLRAAALGAVDGATVGTRIGAYRLVEMIGSGGMGDVYRAVRDDDQYRAEVAVKLMRADVRNPLAEQRFRNERQILAALDHRNIARLLDGGATERGLPYVVMELVAGKPIDRYCDDAQLDSRARVRLFLQVCAAVSFAHQHLVVHRDLKPNNIFVTADGSVKLLDFGIAKLVEVDPETGVIDDATRTQLRAMTLEYASPEHVSGGTVTTASDVYSLGVVLYRLLTGQSPYRAQGNDAARVAEILSDTSPTRPSQLRTTIHAIIDADLDHILLMALRKEPARRYASVEHLADDLRNYLGGLPVHARRGSLAYRSRKFLRRHRVPIGAAALVLVSLVGGLFVAIREARIADEQRQRAQRRFDDVRAFTDAVIFDVHDAIVDLPGATSARVLLLDKAVKYLDSVASDAEGDIDLQRALGWGYQRLSAVQGARAQSSAGDIDAAIASIHKMTALFDAVALANPDDPIDRLNSAMAHRVLALYLRSEPRGRAEVDRAMAITAELIQRSPIPQVYSERSIEFQNLAFIHEDVGDRASALIAYEESLALLLELRKRAPDYRNISRRIGMAQVLLGDGLLRTGQIARALSVTQAGSQLLAEAAKADPSVQNRRDLAIATARTSEALLTEGNLRGAADLLAEAQHLLTPLAESDRANQMLQTDVPALAKLEGRLLILGGRPAEALPVLQQAKEKLIRLHTSPRGSTQVPIELALTNIWLAEAEASLGRSERARLALDEAIGTFADAPLSDEQRVFLATSWIAKGRLLAASGRRAESLAAIAKALDILAPGLEPAFKNLPAIYPAAEAHLVKAQVLASSSAANPADCTEARASLGSARELLGRISAPGTISPLGLPAHLALKPLPGNCAETPVRQSLSVSPGVV